MVGADLYRVSRRHLFGLQYPEARLSLLGQDTDGRELFTRIIFRYLLPSFLSCIIARPTLAIPQMILGKTALSFIGLGLQPPAISWGVLLKDAQAIRVLAL